MKVRTKNLEPSSMPDARSGSRESRIEYRGSLCAFCFFCVSFLAVCFLTPFAGAKISSGQADPNNHLQRQLWQAAISIAKVEQDNVSKNELKRIIEQIRSIEFKPRKQTPEPVIVVEPPPTTQPNETAPNTAVPKQPEKKEAEPKLPYEPITDQILQILKNVSQHPGELNNPFELAEILFLSGNLKEATVFYQEALNRKSPDDPNSAQNRAWILFQIGNCLRNDDLPTALNMYRQLITEYPDSLWADLAKTRCQLIAWYQKDQPRKLIAECRL
ncbi:MAG: tetratricopeptide repeat protein [Planctomycetota bacterium]|jgi:tetratricopeptide (TPR) repeat protein